MKRFQEYTKFMIAFIFCVAVIVVYKTFDNFNDVKNFIGTVLSAFKPFAIAFIIAYILNLPCEKISKSFKNSKSKFLNKHSLGLSIAIVYFITLATIIITICAIVPAIYRNLLELYINLPEYVIQAKNFLSSLETYQKISSVLGDFNLLDFITNKFTNLDIIQFSKYAQGVITVTSGFVSFFISIIISVYMLIDKQIIEEFFNRILAIFLKPKTVTNISKYAKRANNIFTSYIYSRVICSFVMACLSVFVLSIMRVKYAPVLGIFIGFCDLIPYFGSIIATIIAILVTALTGPLWQTIWVGIVLILLQQADGNLIAPKIMSDRLEIRPLLIIVAIMVGGSLFGVLGMLFSVPIFAVIKTMFLDFVESKEHEKNIKKNFDDFTVTENKQDDIGEKL